MHDDGNSDMQTRSGTGRAIGRRVLGTALLLVLLLAVVGAFLVGPLGFVVVLAVGFVLWLAWSAFGVSGPGSA